MTAAKPCHECCDKPATVICLGCAGPVCAVDEEGLGYACSVEKRNIGNWEPYTSCAEVYGSTALPASMTITDSTAVLL